MKLRNKNTGEIGNLVPTKEMKIFRVVDEEWNLIAEYNTIAKLNEEWEDYEEPKEDWFINEFGTVEKTPRNTRKTLYDKARKHFGNYFETKEEAEKAVEKLKAWKRLKDKGIIDIISIEMKTSEIVEGEICTIRFHTTDKQIETDLKLLLGGEE